MKRETITDGMKVTVGGIGYTLKKNKRIKWAELWFVVCDGCKIATIEHREKWGWASTTWTSDYNGALWSMSENTTLASRIKKIADARKVFADRCEFI